MKKNEYRTAECRISNGEMGKNMGNIFLKLKTQDVGGVPAEIQVVPLGEYEDASGQKFRVAEEDALKILQNAGAKLNDLVIDYEHQTLNGCEAPAAAWIKQLINKGKDGIWAVVAWTERAAQYLKNKEYKYLSPVLMAKAKDADGYYRPEFLHSAALTNTPQIDGMVPIVNKGCGACANLGKKEDGSMKRLLELLGLKPEATEVEAAEALVLLKNKANAPAAEVDTLKAELKKVREALGLQPAANLSEVTGTIFALKQPGAMVSVQEFQALKAQLAERQRDELVTLAMKDGKISAAQKDWADKYAMSDPEGFKVFVAKAPVVVPMGDMPKGGNTGAAGGLDETTLLVAKMMGNKPEDVKKYIG